MPPATTKRKAPPIPHTHRPHKRPLLRPPPAKPAIYISTRTPFVSAVKRVQSHLSAQGSTEAVLRASGRAIDMTLQVALYFMEGYRVRVRTGEVKVVDDVVRVVKEEEEGGVEKEGGGEAWKKEEEEEEGHKVEGGDVEDLARERRVSTVEVVISAR